MLAAAVTTEARAEPAAPVDPERHELAGFPILAGNTDIGVQLGVAATLTRFHDGLEPYLWNIDAVFSASVKDDAAGTRLVQQNHVLRLDAPFLFDRSVRLDIRGSFQRAVNAGYFGIGNASDAPPSAAPRQYQYLQEESRVRVIGRYRTGTPMDIAFGTNLRVETPSAFARSRLAEDSGHIIGLRSAALGGVAGGIVIDTRDSEFITRRGVLYELGASYTLGSGERVAYAETSAVLATYAKLPGPFIFAHRFVASLQDGRVPFYDLAQGGVFEPQNLLGSESGIRGVPRGRYAGLIKTVTNLEIRSTLPRFVLFDQRLRFGTTSFIDAGRVWAGYRIDPVRDALKLGLKYGVGGGLFLQWGEAAIFRVEAAYSPDAIAENRSFPIGIYVSDGLMF